MDDIAGEIKERGRADIQSGGLGRKWANALRVLRFPKRGISLQAAVFAFHKIAYADVFEKGLTIRGRPLLWIPLTTTLKKFGNKRLTPAQVATRFGDLVSINRNGQPPLLAARVGGRSGKGRRSIKKVTGAGLIAGSQGRGGLVPLFVGVPRADEIQRTHLLAIFAHAAGHVAERFAARFKAD